ncbi:2-amino-4-hydroxy-6-hydroxymethyldihydropteridin e diphosphokinase [Halorhabdus sp. SVX81]|uniref:6-hydroxymethylpterin diphosphokinase MptE-like protein n=1 Tax=Halorhabdus sp. SVX81 TaxID=2978283 RepID=UPI0023DC9235|nr:6-hydroxymethylpterin diphosphokinase MptE-like protein [Halorhabdus sp. SVX81]WEL18089.1 2-amino-4-hydroxy-6-hydroxymethyldihydropteridin e diphosphokinase [Halorhabdus sp. SVX81]
MDFATWEPVYEAILADFGYDRAGDERARDWLASVFERREVEPYEPAPDAFAGDTVAVAGAGPSLLEDADVVREADRIVAASTAADSLRDIGFELDFVVTDLDKHAEGVHEFTKEGVPVAVHAHGDNVDALRQYVPTFDLASVVPTTQAEPTGPVANYGGFTDGDRAAFLADHLGAEELVFPGWDFEDDSLGEEKRRKLQWAKRLLVWLEQRRNERFGILDGRRDGIDTQMLP